MMRYEYKVLNKYLNNGIVVDGYKEEIVTVKNIFGVDWKEEKKLVKNEITETDWLNSMGELGWELINCVQLVNYASEVRYYFRRLKQTDSDSDERN